MRTLSSIPWDHLTIGDLVISEDDRCGAIIDLLPSPGDKMPSITIRWDGVEAVSYKPHSWTNKIRYVGQSTDVHEKFLRRLIYNFLNAKLDHKDRLERILDRFYP